MSATSTNRGTREWQDSDRDHHLHPFTDHGDLARRGSRIIVGAEGVYLHDSDGNRLLDGMAGLWCVNLGYGRPELVEAARRQLETLPYYNTFFQSSHPPAIELAELLAEITPPQFRRVFFTNSGSEANDTVVRMVRYYWKLMGKPWRRILISRNNAYHGSTVAGASLSGMKPMHGQGWLPIPGVEHIEQPYHYRLGADETPEAFGRRAARWLEERLGEVGPENVAAFIGEPVQGAGGVIVPPASYWPEIERICRRHDILLVADEVICGFGRTGRWFGSETFGIEPDLMPIAKGLSNGYQPIGGVMVSDRVADALTDKGGEFFHGYTWQGHPVAAAVAAETIRIMRRERIVERVAEDVGPYFQGRLRELEAHPMVGEVRGVGLLGGIQLVRNKRTREFFEKEGTVGTRCRDLSVANGLVMRAVGDSMVLSPPLVISHAEIDELIDKARRTLDDTAREFDVGG